MMEWAKYYEVETFWNTCAYNEYYHPDFPGGNEFEGENACMEM